MFMSTYIYILLNLIGFNHEGHLLMFMPNGTDMIWLNFILA